MGRSITLGRRPCPAPEAPPSPAEPEAAAIEDVYQDVLALAEEPLVEENIQMVGRAPQTHSVGRGLTPIVRRGVLQTQGPTPERIREQELTVMQESLAVVRGISNALERGTAPVVDAHAKELEFAREQSREAFELARTIAAREQAVPDIHMHLPEHRVDVTVEGSEINVPPVEAHFHAGDTFVEVPEQKAPQVDVFVPRQEPTVVHVAPAPTEVHNHVAPSPVVVQAAAPPSPTRGIRVERDEDGRKVFVPVEIAHDGE